MMATRLSVLAAATHAHGFHLTSLEFWIPVVIAAAVIAALVLGPWAEQGRISRS